MTDALTPNQRSWNMSRIKSKDTAPEREVRSMLHRLGFRFRLHAKDLPGRPDITLRRFRTVIFVHGCFWHRHRNCKFAYTPRTRIAFWTAKFEGTKKRDRTAKRALAQLGWRVIYVWECELVDRAALARRLAGALADASRTSAR